MTRRATDSRWETAPARRVLKRLSRPVAPAAETVTAFRDGEVVRRSERRTEGFTESLLDIGYQGVRCGDLAVHSMDGFAGAIGVSKSDGKMSPVVHLYESTGRADLRFVQYYLRHLASSGYVQSLAKGIRERSTSFDPGTLADVPIPLPPLEEQRRIADFLDYQTTHIDQIITARKRQVELIVEHGRARIVDVLLSGGSLGGQSANAWFRGLPASWHVRPLRTEWSVIDCKHRTPVYLDSGYPVVSPGDVTPGRLDLGKCNRFVSETDYLDLADDLRRCRMGDIVYSRNASAGTAAYVETTSPFTMGQDVCRITSSRPDQKYLFHALNHLVEPQLESSRIGSTITRINVDRIKSLQIPVPTDDEQQSLADEADSIVGETERGVRAQQRQMDLLRELKRSLVSAAVSGEFDVAAASGRGVPA